jgi:SagB-type dehydrogenase family enzyme
MNAGTITRLLAVVGLFAVAAGWAVGQDNQPTTAPASAPAAPLAAPVALPAPDTSGGMTLNQALATRRSIRAFSDQALTLEQVGQLLWAGQGVTDPQRVKRTAPSAGASYPLELYVAQHTGVARYDPANHQLQMLGDQDVRKMLGRQPAVTAAPLVIVIAADMGRIGGRYGERAQSFVYLEAGHVAQNILLEATALGLGAVPVGAFDPKHVKEALKLPDNLEVLYIVPVGHPRRAG